MRPLTCTLAVVLFLAAVVAIVSRFVTAVVAAVLHVAVGAPCTLVACERRLQGCWVPQTAVVLMAAH